MIVTDSAADVHTPTGPMRTYFYAPQEPGRPPQPRPGLVLYSEIFQQTPPVRRLAVAFAGLGYLVAVPEVYHAHEPPGCVLGYDDPGKNRGNALKQIIPMSDFDADARAAVDALLKHPGCSGRVGAVGICLLPDYMCREELLRGELLAVLPGWAPPPGIFHAVFPSRRGLVPAVRRFLDFLGENVQGDGSLVP